MNTPAISVLMGVYNTPASYLSESIESILNQSFREFEFVIVDDGSDDRNTVECLNQLAREGIINADKRIRLIRNRENVGLTRSLNIGLKQCRGTYVARMDADDVALPDRLERQLRYMEEHPDVVLVGSEIIVFGEGVEECDRSKQYDRMDNPEIYRVHSLIQHSGPPHPTFFLRAEFLKENRIAYREDIPKAQDYGLMADILKVGGVIRKIKEPLLKYRMHAGQVTATSEIEQKAYQSRVSYDYIRFLFPKMREDESAAISMLGNHDPIDILFSKIASNPILAHTCWYILKYREELHHPRTYMHAIQNLLDFNKQENLFDQRVLKTELRAEWWGSGIRNTIKENGFWSLYPFSVASYFDHRKIRKENKRRNYG